MTSAAGSLTIGSDFTVNRLGFGAMRITGDGIWGPPADEAAALATLRRVVELGVNFIDTADSYGPDVSEELIARALAPYADGLIIATKGGQVRPGPNKWVPDGSPEHLRAVCDGSLRRLGLEQIPLYQLHRPDPKVPLAESIGALIALRDEGKIKHIGVSNFSAAQLREIEPLVQVASVQNRFNLGDRGSADVLAYCEAAGIAFIPWAPMHDFADTAEVKQIEQRHQASSRQLALAWLLALSPVMLPIPGTGNPQHAEHNFAAAQIELSAQEVATLTAAAK